jgi:hypothetical protein
MPLTTKTPPTGASDAATWMQVVFGGIGVTVAIVAAVLAYFAWVQPHSPDTPAPIAQPGTATDVTTATSAAPAATVRATSARRTSLGRMTPDAGGSNVRAAGGDLTMPCASGQSDDRQRTVEYDLRARYTTLEADLRVSRAPDEDSRLQIKIFADDREVANHTLATGKADPLKVPVDGAGRMRIQLICESPESEIKFGNPTLIHS